MRINVKTMYNRGDKAKSTKRQHVSPCSDCPFSRKSLRGWLGSLSPERWLVIVHGESRVDCHTKLNQQCAGAGIFRSNVDKDPRDKTLLILPKDVTKAFASDEEFVAHHRNGMGKSWEEGREQVTR